MADFWYETAGKNNDITRVVLSGHLDSNGCNYLLECVEHQIASGATRMTIDCSGLSFISSMGLGALVRAHARMKKLGGEVNLAAVPGAIAKVLTTVSLDRVFQIYPTAEAAVAALEGD